MKRNGAGLASICILSTMVLVYGIFYNQPVSEYGTWLESSISEICQIEMYTKPEQTEEMKRESEWTDYRACTEGFERT